MASTSFFSGGGVKDRPQGPLYLPLKPSNRRVRFNGRKHFFPVLLSGITLGAPCVLFSPAVQ